MKKLIRVWVRAIALIASLSISHASPAWPSPTDRPDIIAQSAQGQPIPPFAKKRLENPSRNSSDDHPIQHFGKKRLENSSPDSAGDHPIQHFGKKRLENAPPGPGPTLKPGAVEAPVASPPSSSDSSPSCLPDQSLEVSRFGQYQGTVLALPPQDQQQLSDLGQRIVGMFKTGCTQVLTVDLTGHTDLDSSKTAEFHNQLSLDRANQVKTFLIGEIQRLGGVPPELVTFQTAGVGTNELKFPPPNTSDQRLQNRRVVIALTSVPGACTPDDIPVTGTHTIDARAAKASCKDMTYTFMPSPLPFPSCTAPTMSVAVRSPIGYSGLGWTMTGKVTENDGLLLEDVTLGSRVMAYEINVPSFKVAPNKSIAHNVRCQLTPIEDPKENCTSRLVDLTGPAIFQEYIEIQATYVVNRIGDVSSLGPDSCLIIRQRFHFFREYDPAIDLKKSCEPAGAVTCARFKPMVEYAFVNWNGDWQITAPQRFVFLRIGDKTGVWKDADCLASTSVRNTCPWPQKPGVPPIFYDFEYPIQQENTYEAIRDGHASTWDNIHLDAVRVEAPGCKTCVHVHWRWGKLTALSELAPHAPPRFYQENGSGNPMIPPGSKQTVILHWVKKKSGEEDPVDYRVLDNKETFSPGDGHVLWYVPTSSSLSDSFFVHGGFFTTHYSTK